MNQDRKWMCLTAIVFGLNVAVFILSLFVFEMKDVAGYLFAFFFLYTVFMHFQMGHSNDQYPSTFKVNNSKAIKLTAWRKLLADGAALCALCLFVFSMIILAEGRGALIDGSFYLARKGDLIRKISEAEYRKLVFAETRMMIGMLLVFTVNPFTYYAEKCVSPKIERQ